MRKIIVILILSFVPIHALIGQWIRSAYPERFEPNGGNFLQIGSRLYLFTVFGPASSSDNGATWSDLQPDSSEQRQVGFMTNIGSSLYWLEYDLIQDTADTGILLPSDTLSVFSSTDSGATWNIRRAYLPSSPIEFGGIYALVSCGSKLIMGGWDGLFVSHDSGATWFNTGVSAAGVYSLFVNNNLVYAGGADGFFLSTDGGLTWSLRNAGFPGFHFTTFDNVSIVARQNTVFALPSTSPVVLFSTDSGKNWTMTTMPGSTSIFIDSDHLFTTANDPTGSSYVSSDNGTTWSDIGGGARAMRGIVSGPNIVVGTTTTGIWYAPLADFGSSSVSSNQQESTSVSAFPNPTPGPFTIRGAAGAVAATNVLGKEVAESGVREPGSGEVELDLSKLPTGTYFVRIETPGGMLVRKIIKE